MQVATWIVGGLHVIVSLVMIVLILLHAAAAEASRTCSAGHGQHPTRRFDAGERNLDRLT